MPNNKTDLENKNIAEVEYPENGDYSVGNPVTYKYKGRQKLLGDVSDKVNDSTGLQAYVVTDKKANADPASVKHVTMLYRGSSTDFSEDMYKDWVETDFPTATNILDASQRVRYSDPAASKSKPKIAPQTYAASDALQAMMKKYPNADFNIHSHSLGSMNGQYAVSNLSKEQQARLSGAYFYQGPNMYELLSVEQRQTVDAMKAQNKLFNYVDQKDIIAIGYDKDGSKAVGNVFFVMSNAVHDVGKQHMWGGYQFNDEGRLLVSEDSMARYVQSVMDEDKKTLETLTSRFKSSGGGISDSEAILLDAVEARAMMRGMLLQLEHEFDQLTRDYENAIENANNAWSTTREESWRIGQTLSESEELSALAAGGVTQQSIKDTPIQEYQDKIQNIKTVRTEYRDFVKDVEEAISNQVQTDQELAQEIKGLLG